MPIYEYYCQSCNTVYQFFARTLEAKPDPACPKHPEHGTISRQMSRFALGRSAAKGEDQAPGEGMASEGAPGADPLSSPRVEAEMMKLMGQMESIDENDGRSMGRLMRRLTEITGEGANDPTLLEAIRRLESGEDPERVEEELGGAFEGGEGGGGGGPSYDSGMYDL